MYVRNSDPNENAVELLSKRCSRTIRHVARARSLKSDTKHRYNIMLYTYMIASFVLRANVIYSLELYYLMTLLFDFERSIRMINMSFRVIKPFSITAGLRTFQKKKSLTKIFIINIKLKLAKLSRFEEVAFYKINFYLQVNNINFNFDL